MVNFDMVGGAVCLDFVNTGSKRRQGPFEDKLTSYDDLVAWAAQAEQLPADDAERLRAQAVRQPKEAQRALERGRALREALYRVFSTRWHEQEVAQADLELISEEYARATSQRTLARAADGTIAFQFRSDAALDRPLWPVAVSAANLLSADDAAARVKECATDNCNWLFYDASKNRSRRWCDMNECGNRAKARRHYERRRRTT